MANTKRGIHFQVFEFDCEWLTGGWLVNGQAQLGDMQAGG
jgi:hypothetical protein